MWLTGLTKALLMMSLVLPASQVAKAPEVRIMVVGDIMMHSPIISSGYNQQTKEYNYDSIFSEVKPIFSEADFVIGNLETPLAGEENGYSGYPRFNAPKEIAVALDNAGVDVLTTANNHSMDQWEKGIINTIDHLDEIGILHTGTFKSEQDKTEPLILEANGIKIGIIANTYGTNGMPVPQDKPYLVNLLDMDAIKEEINILKENDVDYIMSMTHFGYEYHRLPSIEQISWSNALYDEGVDFILGSHPHVVQPLQIVKSDNSFSSDTGTIYSLGNFLSNQKSGWKDYGVILDLTLQKDVITEKVTLKEVNVIPTYVKIGWNKGKKEYKIIPIYSESQDIDQKVRSNGEELVEHVFQTK